MSRDNLLVVQRQDKWHVRSDEEQGDNDMPEYESREAAIDAAINSAQNSAKRGRTGYVYTMDDGEYNLQRTVEPEVN